MVSPYALGHIKITRKKALQRYPKNSVLCLSIVLSPFLKDCFLKMTEAPNRSSNVLSRA
jgi:hypothetical protein